MKFSIGAIVLALVVAAQVPVARAEDGAISSEKMKKLKVGLTILQVQRKLQQHHDRKVAAQPQAQAPAVKPPAEGPKGNPNGGYK